MAIKHVVTRGFGFNDGTQFIPTRGYTPGAVIIPAKLDATLETAAVTLAELTTTPVTLASLVAAPVTRAGLATKTRD